MELKQIEAELTRAFNGLLMRSETDEPFEFYYDEENTAKELNEDTVRKLAGMPAEYPLEVVEVEHFFRNMAQSAPDETGVTPEQAERFRQLQSRLKELLQDVKAYKVGEDRITVLILGKTQTGEIAGIKTVVVET